VSLVVRVVVALSQFPFRKAGKFGASVIRREIVPVGRLFRFVSNFVKVYRWYADILVPLM
jgi:hypothetical protein